MGQKEVKSECKE